MKSMAYSKEELSKKYESKPMMPEQKYPYGLCLHLDNDMLKKLGLDKLPGVGESVMIYAKAEVKSVSAFDSADGGMSKSCDLQVTDMEVEMGGESEKAAKELYGE